MGRRTVSTTGEQSVVMAVRVPRSFYDAFRALETEDTKQQTLMRAALQQFLKNPSFPANPRKVTEMKNKSKSRTPGNYWAFGQSKPWQYRKQVSVNWLDRWVPERPLAGKTLLSNMSPWLESILALPQGSVPNLEVLFPGCKSIADVRRKFSVKKTA